MELMDAKKAHLNPRCTRDVYIELPPEAGAKEGMCGKLEYWLYGFRDAASAWEAFYSERFVGVGFERGKGNGVGFYHLGRDISAIVHGDDFVTVGDPEDLDWIQKLIKGWFEVKVRGRLGSGTDDVKEVEILGRKVRWSERGLEMEADARLRKELLE